MILALILMVTCITKHLRHKSEDETFGTDSIYSCSERA